MENTTEATNSGNSTTMSTERSYVAAAKSTPKPVHPRREQAIILHAEGNAKLFDYIKAIGSKVGPKNVTFASRISNNRVCIYLSNKHLVDQLVQDHPTVPVGDTEISVRRLVNPAKRLLLSNVDPSIPQEAIEAELRKCGLNLVSPVSYLKVGAPED